MREGYMSSKPLKRLYKAATGAALRRDRIEMASIDRLLSRSAPARAPRPMEADAIRRIANAGFRSILCPVDFSPQSRIALRHAAALARRSHGHLSTLYVNDPLLVAAAGIALHDRTLATRNLAELRRLVDSTVSRTVLEPARVDDAVTSGTPADEILKTAKRRRCDLIVMGTHGLTGVDKLLIGSTTLGVLQRTDVPVLVIPRHPGSHRRPAVESPWRGQRIVAAIAMDRRSDGHARAAAAVAHWLGSALLLVHVVPEFKAPRWLRTRMGASDRARIADAQSRLEALAASLRKQVDADTRVLFGDARLEIAKVAATERAGLVITSLRAPGDWFAPRRGSISYGVLSDVTVPVLTLPG
jgi:nucleotide-binding universal stress UspA family protein